MSSQDARKKRIVKAEADGQTLVFLGSRWHMLSFALTHTDHGKSLDTDSTGAE